jgi:hypothetical protein
MRHPTKVLKRRHLSFEESLLFLARVGAYEDLPRIVQAHLDELHRFSFAVHLDYRFAPVHLRILAWIETQWHKHLWPLILATPPPQVHVHSRLTAPIPGCVNRLVYFVSRVALLARHALTFCQQRIDLRFVRP